MTTMALDSYANTDCSPSEQIERQLADLIKGRLEGVSRDNYAQVIRSPAGLLFVRGDRAGTGKEISNEVKASFDYWDIHANSSIDILFSGWKRNEKEFLFDRQRFLQLRRDIERRSRWRFSGETELILFNFDYDVQSDIGEVRLGETIRLPVEAMLRDKRISSLDILMHQIIEGAHAVKPDAQSSPIWQISDRIGFLRGREMFWEKLKNFILRDLSDFYHHLEPFSVQDFSIVTS